jgi:hypothetical protein
MSTTIEKVYPPYDLAVLIIKSISQRASIRHKCTVVKPLWTFMFYGDCEVICNYEVLRTLAALRSTRLARTETNEFESSIKLSSTLKL